MNFNRSFALAAAVITLVIAGCSQPSDLAGPGLEPQFGTPASDRALAVTKYGSAIYVVGTTSGNLHATNKGSHDVFIRKLDTSGRLVWGRQFGTAASESAVDVATDANGNAYVLGSTGGSLAGTLRGPTDFFLRKYTPSGTVAWTRQMGLDTADHPGGVAVSGGFVYVVGVSQNLGTFVYRLYVDGRSYWKKQVAPFIEYRLTSDVTVDGSGGIYVAATVAADCGDWWQDCTATKLNKYNAAGSLAWSKRVAYDDEENFIALAAHGSSVYLATERYTAYDDDSYTYLTKLDASGVVNWSRGIDYADAYDPPLSVSTDLSADASGVYTVSTEQWYLDDDPRSPTYSVAKFGTGGSPVWRVGAVFDPDGSTEEYIDGSLWGVVARGGELYVAGSVDGGASRRSEALLKRLNAATGSTVWQR